MNYSTKNEYNWWRQTNFPLNEEDSTTKTTAYGYEPIVILIPNDKHWGGLVKSIEVPDYGCKPSLLDGCVGSSNWYYTIGLIKDCSKYTHIPTDKQEYQSTLYIRIPDTRMKTCKRKQFNLVYFLFTQILIL